MNSYEMFFFIKKILGVFMKGDCNRNFNEILWMNCGFFLLNIIEEILGFGSYNIGILVGLLIMLVSFKGSRGSFGFY